MRTTVTLDGDVAAAVEKLRRQRGAGVSEVVNGLVRAGLAQPAERHRYHHRTSNLGIRVDVSDVGAVLELLDES